MSNPKDEDDEVFTVYDKSGGEHTVYKTLEGFELGDGTTVERLDEVRFVIKTNPPIRVEIEHYIDTEVDEED